MLNKILSFLKREPVAVWGVVIAAVLSALSLAGVPATDVEIITGILTAAGVPVVRGKVTPVQAVEAVLNNTADTASVS